MKKSKILITGGSGLLALNWFISVRDRYDVVLVFHERIFSVSLATTCVLDLRSPDSIREAIHYYKPKYVVHAAGLTNVEKCETNADMAYLTNVVLASNVASACKSCNIPLVHISTDHLFSGKNALASEGEVIMPLNIYAKTKAEAETIISRVYPEALIVRTNFYGWGTCYRESFSDFILNFLRGGTSNSLFGDVFYTPILIEQLVNLVEELLARNAFGVFNLVGSERLTKYDFGLKLAEVFELNPELIQRGSIHQKSNLVLRPHDMSLSNRKVCEFLGFDPGGVTEQLKLLRLQEHKGIAEELAKL
jgi:dTDP-4-dehydrorhamnose reductase